MKKIINKLREKLGTFFNIVPGYYSAKEEIFEIINELENYDRNR